MGPYNPLRYDALHARRTRKLRPGRDLLTVWQQSLVDRAKQVVLEGKTYPVRRTAKRNLAQVDFVVGGISYRALEQNPETKSRWAELARKGAKVMQFLSAGRYVGVVVDGKLTHYSRAKS